MPKTYYIYKYIKSVSSLFGAQFTSPPTLVRVQFTNERRFEEWLNDLRPSERKSSSFNDLHFDYGLLYSDAAFLDQPQSPECTTFAVEIKPKQGWHIRQLPDNVLKLFGVERDAIDKCRFCSMQFLKVCPKCMGVLPTDNRHSLNLFFSFYFRMCYALHWNDCK